MSHKDVEFMRQWYHEGMKWCPKCKTEKTISEFGKNKSRSDGLQGYCKWCRNSQVRNWYSKNKEVQWHRVAKCRPKRKKAIHLKLIEYYQNNPCVDCGETDWMVLESDHVGKKTMAISKMLAMGHSWENILLELKNCVTRCGNCHRRKTIKQFEYYKYLD